MADGRHFENRSTQHLLNRLTDVNEIWCGDARWLSRERKWRRADILEIDNITTYLQLFDPSARNLAGYIDFTAYANRPKPLKFDFF